MTKENEQLKELVEANRDIGYSAKEILIPSISESHKYVGAQIYNDALYGIPNDARRILKFDEEGKGGFMSEFENGLFKWTGGCVVADKLYCFPRTSDSMIEYSFSTGEISRIFCGKKYEKEHHYGGCLVENRFVYQPPRDNNHILVWDLVEKNTREILIAGGKRNYRYCGSIFHNNGFIYMMPEMGEKVLRLDVKTDQIDFLGESLFSMVFDANIWIDGNIYGYSAYGKGIIKIDTINETVEILHENEFFGSFGTKLGINGKLYSIPGDSDVFWEYDASKDMLHKIGKTQQTNMSAKYAGGAIDRWGRIWGVPAENNAIACLVPDNEQLIPDEVYEAFYTDCY